MQKHGTIINGSYVSAWKFAHRRTTEHFGKAEAAYLKALDLAGAVAKKADDIQRDRNLSDLGRKEAMRTWTRDVAQPILKNAAAAISAARDRAGKKRSELKPDLGDGNDFRAVMIRMETRRRIEAMEPAKRNAFVMMTTDPDILLAIAEAPAEHSGITQEQKDRLSERTQAAQHPEAAAEIAELEEAAEITESAVRASTEQIVRTGGISRRELPELLGEPTLKSILARMREENSDDNNQNDATA